MVPLSSFVTIEHTTGPEFTNRFNLFRSAEIIGIGRAGIQLGPGDGGARGRGGRGAAARLSYAWTALSYQEANGAELDARLRPRRCSSCS